MRITQKQLIKIIKEELKNMLEDKSGKGKCPDSGCITERDGKWRIISNKTGELWPQTYDSHKDAKAGLDAYHGGY